MRAKKPISLELYKANKEFMQAIESGELYEQLKPKPEKDKKNIPKKDSN